MDKKLIFESEIIIDEKGTLTGKKNQPISIAHLMNSMATNNNLLANLPVQLAEQAQQLKQEETKFIEPVHIKRDDVAGLFSYGDLRLRDHIELPPFEVCIDGEELGVMGAFKIIDLHFQIGENKRYLKLIRSFNSTEDNVMYKGIEVNRPGSKPRTFLLTRELCHLFIHDEVINRPETKENTWIF